MSDKITAMIPKGSQKLKAKIIKNGPKIGLVAGVTGLVVSGIIACIETIKAKEILDQRKNDIANIQYLVAEEGNEYSDEEAASDIRTVNAKTVLNLAKTYAPAVILATASVLDILYSNGLLEKRYSAASAAYAATHEAFKRYKKTVEEKFGMDAENEIRMKSMGISTIETEETTKDEKTGKEKKIKKKEYVMDGGVPEPSLYAKFFDESSEYWEKDPEYNLMFLRHQQEFANHLLRSRKRLFLNEVYRMLGITETKAGQIVGWIYDENNPIGDNYVDFGIYDVRNKAAHNFVNCDERSILLDFNVDGNILELMK